MFLFAPPTIDVNSTVTLVKYEIYCEYNVSSTYFDNTYHVNPDDMKLLDWNNNNNNILSTNLRLENNEDEINSTWEEIDINEFDIISKVKFSNIIKVKGRIKTVSKYKPNIIID